MATRLLPLPFSFAHSSLQWVHACSPLHSLIFSCGGGGEWETEQLLAMHASSFDPIHALGLASEACTRAVVFLQAGPASPGQVVEWRDSDSSAPAVPRETGCCTRASLGPDLFNLLLQPAPPNLLLFSCSSLLPRLSASPPPACGMLGGLTGVAHSA
jgi:hypothetical protein